MDMRGCVLLLAFAASAAAQSLLSQADQAWSKGDIAGFKETLRKAESAVDHAGASRRLAVMSWRLYADFGAAESHFTRAEQAGVGVSETLAARARMETARSRYDAGRAAARRALAVATADRDRNAARTAFAHATVEEALAGGSSDAASEALDLVTEAVRAEPGLFRSARFMYGLALLLGDRERAQEALNAYHWGGKPLPLYPEAGLAGKPVAVVRYAKFCYRVRNAVDEFYRWRCSRRPLGLMTSDENTKLRGIVLTIAAETWTDIRTVEQLSARVAEFNGFLEFQPWGLAFGHRVLDASQEFEQYGRKTRGVFILLDDMISNGSVSWYSDGASVIGGWAGPPMVQIRTEAAIRSWLGRMDPKRRAESDRRLAEATAADDEVARKNPHAYLEGLAMRMRRRAHTDVLAALKPLEGNSLRLAFLGEVQRRQTACVQAHEARHRIEGPTTSGMERERNAALSQVIFGGHPADCMAGILVPNLGLKDNGSAEGAGEIMKGIVRWMAENAGAIAGFDKSRPALPQFDKLTDAQIVEAFQSMDPWSKRE